MEDYSMLGFVLFFRFLLKIGTWTLGTCSFKSAIKKECDIQQCYKTSDSEIFSLKRVIGLSRDWLKIRKKWENYNCYPFSQANFVVIFHIKYKNILLKSQIIASFNPNMKSAYIILKKHLSIILLNVKGQHLQSTLAP